MQYSIHIFTYIQKYFVTTLRYWTPIAHTKHTLLSLSHSYSLLLPPVPSYHPHCCHHNWGPCHSHFFHSVNSRCLPPFPCSFRIWWSVISVTLHSPPPCFSDAYFLLALIFPRFPFGLIFLCPLLSPGLRLPSTSHFRQSPWVITSLNMASTTTQILMGLNSVSPAQTSLPEFWVYISSLFETC